MQYANSIKISSGRWQDNNQLYRIDIEPDDKKLLDEKDPMVVSQLGEEDERDTETNMDEDLLKEDVAVVLRHRDFIPEADKVAALLQEYPILHFFYPNLKGCQFEEHLQRTIGGLAMHDECYRILGIRNPLTKEANPPSSIGEKEIAEFYRTYYNITRSMFGYPDMNPEYITFCLKLYSIIGELLDQVYTPADWKVSVMQKWSQQVKFYASLPYLFGTDAYMDKAQHLYDLFWAPTDNPESIADITAARISFAMCIKQGKVELTENTGITNDRSPLYYLLENEQYPVYDRTSVRLAMDNIRCVPKEHRKAYCKKLNEVYHALRLHISLSQDHPYMGYASKEIYEHSIPVCAESSSVVADDTTETDDRPQPWFLRVDQRTDNPDHEFYPNTEMGPNTHKTPKDDFTKHYSIL